MFEPKRESSRKCFQRKANPGRHPETLQSVTTPNTPTPSVCPTRLQTPAPQSASTTATTPPRLSATRVRIASCLKRSVRWSSAFWVLESPPITKTSEGEHGSRHDPGPERGVEMLLVDLAALHHGLGEALVHEQTDELDHHHAE